MSGMSHASFSYDAGEVKEEKVVFPVPRIWDRRVHLFLSEDLSLRQNMHNGESLEIEEDCLDRFAGSAPAPPDATVTLRITAGDGTEFPRVEQYNKWQYLSLNNEEGLRLSVDPSAEWGDRKVGDLAGRLANTCRKPLPPGTVTTIVFHADPTREKRIDVEVTEPPKPTEWEIQTGTGDTRMTLTKRSSNEYFLKDRALQGGSYITKETLTNLRKAIESAEAAQ